MILKEAPEGSEVLDLDGLRAARAELVKDEPGPVVKIVAGFIELKPSLDVTAAIDFSEGRFRDGLGKLLADPSDVDELIKTGFSTDDINSLTMFIAGRSLGE
ncbi:MAG: hypothetical protein ABIP33_06475 [Pseudolysinimonas sp.]